MLLVCSLMLCLCLCLGACGQEEPKQTPADEPGASAHSYDAPDAQAIVADGWVLAESTLINDVRSDLFQKAVANMGANSYVPVAYLGRQGIETGGSNHCYLACVTYDEPATDPLYSLIYIFEDANGGASVQHVVQVTPDMFYN